MSIPVIVPWTVATTALLVSWMPAASVVVVPLAGSAECYMVIYMVNAKTTCGPTTMVITAIGTTPIPITVATTVKAPGTHVALAAVVIVSCDGTYQ
jgi:hypothetical protein